MLPYPHINPVIFKVGPFSVRWYGLMYVVSFFVCLYLCKYQLKERGKKDLIPFLENLLFYSFIGLIIGARIGFCFFYYPEYYLKHPLQIFAVWKGGMSFHGGLIGAVLTGYYYVKKHRQSFLWWADLIVVTAPVTLFFGRIGNFINGEIYGKCTTLPWGMIFPAAPNCPRHPDQLYECIVTGLFLFIFMWKLRNKPWPNGAKLGVFLIAYGILRFFFEFIRVPAQGFPLLFGWMTMGQVLCIGMILFGIGLLWWVFRKKGEGKDAVN